MVAVGHPRAGRVSPYHTRDTIPAIASADLPATLAPPAMPARIIRINVARVGEAAAAALPRLDAEVALQLDYINGALEGREYILGNELTRPTSSSALSANSRLHGLGSPLIPTSRHA
jgi:glutathione S-transferase